MDRLTVVLCCSLIQAVLSSVMSQLETRALCILVLTQLSEKRPPLSVNNFQGIDKKNWILPCNTVVEVIYWMWEVELSPQLVCTMSDAIPCFWLSSLLSTRYLLQGGPEWIWNLFSDRNDNSPFQNYPYVNDWMLLAIRDFSVNFFFNFNIIKSSEHPTEHQY